jgi:hypothetical protein
MAGKLASNTDALNASTDASPPRAEGAANVSHSTEVQHITAAVKSHRCSWCDQRIEAGQPYKRYRWFDGGEAETCRLHPECFDAMEIDCELNGGWIEWTPGQERPECLTAEQKAKGQDHG